MSYCVIYLYRTYDADINTTLRNYELISCNCACRIIPVSSFYSSPWISETFDATPAISPYLKKRNKFSAFSFADLMVFYCINNFDSYDKFIVFDWNTYLNINLSDILIDGDFDVIFPRFYGYRESKNWFYYGNWLNLIPSLTDLYYFPCITGTIFKRRLAASLFEYNYDKYYPGFIHAHYSIRLPLALNDIGANVTANSSQYNYIYPYKVPIDPDVKGVFHKCR